MSTEPAPSADPFPVVRVAHIRAEHTEPGWLIASLWGEQAVGFIGGTPKSCKTWLALELAVAVASGRPCLGRFEVTDPGHVLLYAAEDSAPDIRRRVAAIAQARRVDLERLAVGLITQPALQLDRPGDQLRLEATIAKVKPRMLVLDPLVRRHRGDENSAADTSALLAFLRGLQREHGVAIVVVHHVRKAAAASQPGQALRGSGDLHAWSDSNLFLLHRSGRLELHAEHRNHPAPASLAVELATGPEHLVLVETDAEALPDEVRELRRQVIEAVAQGPTTRTALRDQLRVRNETLGQVLAALETEGFVRRVDGLLTVPRSRPLGNVGNGTAARRPRVRGPTSSRATTPPGSFPNRRERDWDDRRWAAPLHLRALRPLPCEIVDGAPATKWHRAVDARLCAIGGATLRGGDPSFGFIHPPNALKVDRDRWLLALDRLEDGFVPDVQRGNVELVGEVADWLGPKRPEPYVFLVQGRNVPPSRFRRCIASMVRQKGCPWGAIVMDDASDPELADDIARVCAPYRDRVTVVRVRQRRIKLANTVWAVRHLVLDPDAVVVMLDADDALIGSQVLERIGREYDAGADITVGSMLRTDKVVDYSPVNLEDPRAARGGFVWQHLRTFRKRLFEEVPDEYLRMDGRYVELADDWAQVVPMVELATRPVYIPDPLYPHEPSSRGRGEEWEARERVIGALMSRPQLSRSPMGRPTREVGDE